MEVTIAKIKQIIYDKAVIIKQNYNIQWKRRIKREKENALIKSIIAFNYYLKN